MQSLRLTSIRRLCLSATTLVTRRQPNPLLLALACREKSFTSSPTRWYSSIDQFHHQNINETKEEVPSEVEEVENASREARSATNTLFIGNLPWSVTEDELQEILSVYGPLTRVAIARDGDKSKGYAHVEFESKQDATKATKDHNESPMMIGDREIRIDYAYPVGRKGDGPLPRRAVKDRHEPSSTIFVARVPYEAKEEDIREALKSFGNIVAVRIALDREGGPRGFVHVDFANTAEAEQVLEHYQHHPIYVLDREVRMDRSSPPEMAHPPSSRLYFANWGGGSASLLRSHFGALRSKIAGLYFIENRNPDVLTKSGFIEFRDLEAAKEALTRFNAPGLDLAYARSSNSGSRHATRGGRSGHTTRGGGRTPENGGGGRTSGAFGFRHTRGHDY